MASKARGETKAEQKQAYKAAMRALQDDYYENVAAHCGLTRLGPGRQRLTREEWTEQQRQAKSLANARTSLMADLETATAQAKEVIDRRDREDPGGGAGPSERRHDADASAHRGDEAEGRPAHLGRAGDGRQAGKRTRCYR